MRSSTTAQHFSSLTAARELGGFRLSESADVRGWTVVAHDGLPAGTVNRLMVDTRTRQVRYLGVVLDPTLERRKGFLASRTVLVPVGFVERVDGDHTVVLGHLTVDMLRRAPRIPARPVTRLDEEETLAAYGLQGEGKDGDADFYAGSLFDSTNLLHPGGARSRA